MGYVLGSGFACLLYLSTFTYGTHNVPSPVLSALQTLIYVTFEVGTMVTPLLKKTLRHGVDKKQHRK